MSETSKSFTLVENSPFPASVGGENTEELLVSRLFNLRKRERKLLGRLKRAAPGKAKERARHACLGSNAFMVCSAVDANKNLPVERRYSLAEVFQAAHETNWGKRPEEPVRVFVKPKHNGGFRPICTFDLKYRMVHVALCNLLSPDLKPKSFQREYQSGGLPHVMADITAAVVAGKVWAVRLDIDKFYPSFREDQLIDWLPLPKNVVAYAITGNHMNVATKPVGALSYQEIATQARRGLPQGSALSPIIGSMSIATLDPLPGVATFNWVDDFLLLGETEEQVTAAADALIAAVAVMPGGHFSLKVKKLSHAHDGMAFLGHTLKLANGAVEISPAHPDDLFRKLDELDTRIGQLICSPDPPSPSQVLTARKLAGDMWVYAHSWAKAFRACSNIDEFLNMAVSVMEPTCTALQLSVDDLQNYSNPRAMWEDHYSSYGN